MSCVLSWSLPGWGKDCDLFPHGSSIFYNAGHSDGGLFQTWQRWGDKRQWVMLNHCVVFPLQKQPELTPWQAANLCIFISEWLIIKCVMELAPTLSAPLLRNIVSRGIDAVARIWPLVLAVFMSHMRNTLKHQRREAVRRSSPISKFYFFHQSCSFLASFL